MEAVDPAQVPVAQVQVVLPVQTAEKPPLTPAEADVPPTPTDAYAVALGVKDAVLVRMRYSPPPAPSELAAPLAPPPPPAISSIVFVVVHVAGTVQACNEPVVVMMSWQVAPTTTQPPGQAAKTGAAPKQNSKARRNRFSIRMRQASRYIRPGVGRAKSPADYTKPRCPPR